MADVSSRPFGLVWGLPNEGVASHEGSMESSAQHGIVADPVGHISISGVHGIAELKQRLSRTPSAKRAYRQALVLLATGATIGLFFGAVLAVLLRR